MYYVYILYSNTTDRFYKGQTSDLQDRLNRHNSGYEKSTAPGKPWTLVWHTEKQTRSEAVTLEIKLKNMNREKLELFIQKYSGGSSSRDE